ncbi:hypothetical protein FISHEDRAFT_22185, partial [Fistulina hepatica ATCC 64428]
QLPIQCKQCALRFPDSDVGKKALQDHLDMHFRQNRKASMNIGRGHSRGWFVSQDDWRNEYSSQGKNRAEAEVADEAKADEAKLRASFVVVPHGEEASTVVCPVCKESFKSEFNEDDEEWVWRNAVKKEDKACSCTFIYN